MTERKSDFTLPTNMLDDLFSTQEERDDAKLSKIRDIPLIEIDDFPEHPFKVRDDEDMITDEQIQEIYASDLREYRDNRIFSIHTQSIDSLENDESRNGLYKKFVTSTTCSMDMSECSRFEWIEEIENSVLYLAISELAVQQKELLTLLFIDGYSQVEIAEFFHTSKDAINKRFLRINKRITASVAKQGGLYK